MNSTAMGEGLLTIVSILFNRHNYSLGRGLGGGGGGGGGGGKGAVAPLFVHLKSTIISAYLI